jgi:hypothetical protein
MPYSRAIDTGSSNQPRLSLELKNPDLNLIRLAFSSSSWLHFLSWRLLEEKLEEECWSLREIHARRRKIESKKGKASGFFKKCFIDDNLEWFCS